MRVFPSQSGKPMRGFTLIEVMITVAIVGILAGIALPAYFDSVTRSRFIDGTTKLGDFRSKMEKYFADNRTYLDVAGVGCGVPNPGVVPSDYFTITCGPPAAAPTATTYVLRATGIAAKGTGGFVFEVTQTNAKSSTGPAGWSPGVGCWAMRKDGSC